MNNFQKKLLKEYFRLILSERKHGEVGRIHQNIHRLPNNFIRSQQYQPQNIFSIPEKLDEFDYLKKVLNSIRDQELVNRICNFPEGDSIYEFPVELEEKLKQSNAQGGPGKMADFSYDSLAELLDDYISNKGNRIDNVYYDNTLNFRQGPSLKEEASFHLKADPIYLDLSAQNDLLAFAFEFFDRYFYKGNFVKDFKMTKKEM